MPQEACLEWLLLSVTINQKRKVYVFSRMALPRARSTSHISLLYCLPILLSPPSLPSSPKALFLSTSWLILHCNYPESCCRLSLLFLFPALWYCLHTSVCSISLYFPISLQLTLTQWRITEDFFQKHPTFEKSSRNVGGCCYLQLKRLGILIPSTLIIYQAHLLQALPTRSSENSTRDIVFFYEGAVQCFLNLRCSPK